MDKSDKLNNKEQKVADQSGGKKLNTEDIAHLRKALKEKGEQRHKEWVKNENDVNTHTEFVPDKSNPLYQEPDNLNPKGEQEKEKTDYELRLERLRNTRDSKSEEKSKEDDKER